MSSYARRHWPIILLLGAGIALRAITSLAYTPALFSPDSRLYLEESADLSPSVNWPIGYAAFLRLLPLDHGLWVVPLAQHVLGLLAAVLLYGLMLRLEVRRWLAALAAAPLLLDAYQLNIEQYVLSEALFGLLLVAAAAVLLWAPPLGTTSAALAALALAGAALTRAIAVLAVAPALLTVLFLSAGMPWRARLTRATAFLGAFVLVVGGYVAWYHSVHGTYSLAGHSGQRLYGRVVPWVDCAKFSVPAFERPLCPPQPVGSRPRVFRLVWAKSSPITRLRPPPGLTRAQVASQFARRAIVHQPLAYGRAVAADVLTSFSPTKKARGSGYRVSQWQFQLSFPIPGYPPTWSTSPPPGFDRDETGRVDRSLASFLRGYQRFGYTPGPLLGLGLLVGLAAAFGAGGARRSGRRSAAFLLTGVTIAICFGSVALVPFSWRYQLPQLVFVPAAAAVGITALTQNRSRSAASRDEPAEEAFTARRRSG